MKIGYNFLFIALTAAINNHATHHDINIETIKENSNKVLLSFPGKIADMAISYGTAGYGLKVVGATLHVISGIPKPYNYNAKQFGQINTVEYPTEIKATSSFKQVSSNLAHKFLKLGSTMHWPVRSVKEFTQGVLLQQMHIMSCTQDNAEMAEILKGMKKVRNRAALTTPFGITALVAPSFALYEYEKYKKTACGN